MIILQSVIFGGVGFLGVMHLDVNTPECRWRWRFNRLFWYRPENRFQVPLTPLLPEFFLRYHRFTDFADLQNIFLDLCGVHLENLVDRSNMLIRIMNASMWSVWWLWGGGLRAQNNSTVRREKPSDFWIIDWVCSLSKLASRRSCCRAGIADNFLDNSTRGGRGCGSIPQSTKGNLSTIQQISP